MIYNSYDNYDVDNPDLEEEMYLRDIAEEEEEMMKELESDEDDEDSSSNDNSSDNSSDESSDIAVTRQKRGRKSKVRNVKITENYLAKQLLIKEENCRDKFTFIYNGLKYTGKVIAKLREDNYVFEVTTDENYEKTLKQIKLSKLEKV